MNLLDYAGFKYNCWRTHRIIAKRAKEIKRQMDNAWCVGVDNELYDHEERIPLSVTLPLCFGIVLWLFLIGMISCSVAQGALTFQAYQPEAKDSRLVQGIFVNTKHDALGFTFPVPVLALSGDTQGTVMRDAGEARESTRTCNSRTTLAAGKPFQMETFLDALASVESGRDPRARGKHGEAGAFQIKPIVCRQYGISYKLSGTNDRTLARRFTNWLRSNLAARLHRPPTVAETYAAYQMGLEGFQSRGLSLQRCPKAVINATQRLENLYEL